MDKPRSHTNHPPKPHQTQLQLVIDLGRRTITSKLVLVDNWRSSMQLNPSQNTYPKSTSKSLRLHVLPRLLHYASGHLSLPLPGKVWSGLHSPISSSQSFPTKTLLHKQPKDDSAASHPATVGDMSTGNLHPTRIPMHPLARPTQPTEFPPPNYSRSAQANTRPSQLYPLPRDTDTRLSSTTYSAP